MGYGNVIAYGTSAIKTPNIDRLTGKYAWRKQGTGIAPGDRVPCVFVENHAVVNLDKNDALFSQIDLYASLAKITGVAIEEGQAPDSKNALPVLLNQNPQSREFLVEQSLNSTLSLLVGNWKYNEPSKGPKIIKIPIQNWEIYLSPNCIT